MKVFRRAFDISKHLDILKRQGSIIGFVPTMGALHEGHLSLIRASNRICDLTVCSIFVNPTQFSNPEDLNKYPRTIRKDISWLKREDVAALFMPETNEIYPENANDPPEIDLMGMDLVLEGEYRPGHFNGVIQVMYRLLEIISPHKLFMGQKDFQQHRLVSMMIDQLKYPIDLIICPIVRESDGLAMSSRNGLLTKKLRDKAKIIFQTLSWAKENFDQSTDIRALERKALDRLGIHAIIPEYFQIINGYNLNPLRNWEESDYAVACTAVSAGNVRLIDNMIFKTPGN
jgi:pantoate--beta-alanine ligase